MRKLVWHFSLALKANLVGFAALDETQSLHPFVVVASVDSAVITEEFNQIVGQDALITFV